MWPVRTFVANSAPAPVPPPCLAESSAGRGIEGSVGGGKCRRRVDQHPTVSPKAWRVARARAEFGTKGAASCLYKKPSMARWHARQVYRNHRANRMARRDRSSCAHGPPTSARTCQRSRNSCARPCPLPSCICSGMGLCEFGLRMGGSASEEGGGVENKQTICCSERFRLEQDPWTKLCGRFGKAPQRGWADRAARAGCEMASKDSGTMIPSGRELIIIALRWAACGSRPPNLNSYDSVKRYSQQGRQRRRLNTQQEITTPPRAGVWADVVQTPPHYSTTPTRSPRSYV